MRNEREMMALITGVARDDDRIRAALLVGSRANPDAPGDVYQDYDVTFFVRDAAPFYGNDAWICEMFGEPLIMQKPEAMTLLPPDGDGHFTWLMIFPDGNRIDLSVEDQPYVDDGEPAVVLLDKDGLLPPLPPRGGEFWHVKPPTAKLFADCCNEFWWCLNNVAKGIARDELPYAMHMFQLWVRDMLDQMLAWSIGARRDFAVDSGKQGKYFKRLLPPDWYERYRATYSDADYAHVWAAVMAACGLFRDAALDVAGRMGFAYNEREEAGMRMYMDMVRTGKLEEQ